MCVYMYKQKGVKPTKVLDDIKIIQINAYRYKYPAFYLQRFLHSHNGEFKDTHYIHTGTYLPYAFTQTHLPSIVVVITIIVTLSSQTLHY